MQYQLKNLRLCRKNIGGNIKNIRLSKNIDLQHFSQSCGFGVKYIQSIEAGKRDPSIGDIYRIACYLDAKIQCLFNKV